ncbi:MAG: exodeoxyribonuclease VII small subunit [Anaerolineales bacterium]|jgi:exodeoxyribonuclease VII small subunit
MPPRKKKKTADQEPGYEESFVELQEIVATLEAGDVPLEEAMALFERGQMLTKRCNELLQNAELRIRKLVQSSDSDDPEA